MKEIRLTQNQVALIDDDDYEFLSQWKWFAIKSDKTFYAVRTVFNKGNFTRLQMHNIIWERHYGEVGIGLRVDHSNQRGYDNQKFNLRLATPAQQCQNRRVLKNNTSGFIGVSLHKQSGKYRAVIGVNKRSISLGLFWNPVEAAQARDEAAIKYHGEFAVLNFPLDTYTESD